MTLWEYGHLQDPPIYPTTLEDENGHPLGLVLPDGTFRPKGSSNLGRMLNHAYDHNSVLVTVWDGTNLDPRGGSTKGQLLGDMRTKDSTRVMRERNMYTPKPKE